jgi:hypothetical protein
MRPFFNYIQNHFTQKIVGVEVGVKKGENAVQVLNTLPNLTQFYLVDRWKAYSIEETVPVEQNAGYMLQYKFDQWKAEAYSNCASNPKVIILEMDSSIAANKFINEHITVDFVYIDASHKYEFVLRDCQTWLPVIKLGGVIGGHDFNNRNAPEVACAAKEFATLIKKSLEYANEDWWIQL